MWYLPNMPVVWKKRAVRYDWSRIACSSLISSFLPKNCMIICLVGYLFSETHVSETVVYSVIFSCSVAGSKKRKQD